MVTIYNSDLSKELREGAKIQTGAEGIPSQLNNIVIPTLEVNPKVVRYSDFFTYQENSATGSVTMLTVPTGRQFILNGFSIGISNDASCDNTSLTLTATNLLGAATRLFHRPKQTLTACSFVDNVEFPRGVIIGSGVSINLSGSFTLGTLTKTCCLQGYFIDNPNA